MRDGREPRRAFAGPSADGDRYVVQLALVPVEAAARAGVAVRAEKSVLGGAHGPDDRVGDLHLGAVDPELNLGGGLDALDVVPVPVGQAGPAGGVVAAN